jgi:hypothetical protein
MAPQNIFIQVKEFRSTSTYLPNSPRESGNLTAGWARFESQTMPSWSQMRRPGSSWSISHKIPRVEHQRTIFSPWSVESGNLTFRETRLERDARGLCDSSKSTRNFY